MEKDFNIISVYYELYNKKLILFKHFNIKLVLINMTKLLLEEELRRSIQESCSPYNYKNIYCAGIWQECIVIYYQPHDITCTQTVIYNYKDKSERYLEQEFYPYIYKNRLITIFYHNIIIREGINVKKIPYFGFTISKHISEYIIFRDKFYNETFMKNLITLEARNLGRSLDEKEVLGMFKQNESEYLLLCDYLTLQKYHIESQEFVKSVKLSRNYEYIFVSDKIYMFSDFPLKLYILSLNLDCEYIIELSISSCVLSACKIGSNIMFGGDKLFSIDLNKVTLKTSDEYLADTQQNNPTFKKCTLSRYVLKDNTLVRNITEHEDKFKVIATNVILESHLSTKFKEIYKQPNKSIRLSLYSDKPFDAKYLPPKYKELIIQLILIGRRKLNSILYDHNITDSGQSGIPKDIILHIVKLVYFSETYC